MALTYSNLLPLGTSLPPFNLLDSVSGNMISYTDFEFSKGLVVLFICNHCPFVHHVNQELVRLYNDYRILGFEFVAISSNDVVSYPQDGLYEMRERARIEGYNFPYLYDESQEVARSFQAACTPDFYLFNNLNLLVYRGQLDDSRPGNGIPVSGRSLREAMDAILNNRTISSHQKPSVGCGIKWK
ncbi:MAG: thioredoxin family protein [Nonlabens sp.]